MQKYMKQGVLFSLALLFAFAVKVNANETDDIVEEEPIIVIEEPVIILPVWEEDMISERTPTRRVNHIALRGVFPDILPAFGESYVEINERISAAATDLIDGALRLRARTITFSYDVHSTIYNETEVVSVVMYASIAAVTVREAVRTINFNAQTGEAMTLACVMGENFAPLPMRILTEWTHNYPERYYSAQNAPLSAFYITDTQLILLFDEFQISTAAGGLGRLEMTLDRIIRLEPIPPHLYQIREDIYNLKMVPIRLIIEEMGYDVDWDRREGRVHIWRSGSRDDNDLMMEIIMGQNRYGWGDVPARALEALPMIDLPNGRILIPITFFDQIMPRTIYYVDDDGYIHFLAYMPAR